MSSDSKQNRLKEIRKIAEQEVKCQKKTVSQMSEKDIEKLVFELEVHQIELEMQNEELKQTNNELLSTRLGLEEIRRKYFELYNLAPAGYTTFDKNGIILETNLTTANLLGIKKNFLLKTRLYDYIVIEDKDIFFNHLREVFHSQKHHSCELRMLKKNDNKVIYINCDSCPSSDNKGIDNTCNTIITDITEKKKMQQNLIDMFNQVNRNYNNTLSILNLLKIGVVLLDEKGRILFINKTLELLFGKNLEKIKEDNWEDVFPLNKADKQKLKNLLNIPQSLRKVLLTQLEYSNDKCYHIEIDVLDDPHTFEKKIICLYDVSEIYNLKSSIDDIGHFNIVGKSDRITKVIKQIEKLTGLSTSVLIEGETGTGKELAARALHYFDFQEKKPFIVVNCSGMNDSLLLSELFGHRKGSFTGAIEDHKGLFAAADGGAIFLDEIGDISASMQMSLLRILEDHEIMPIGESKTRKINIRVIAATNKNLIKEIEIGRFRKDLFYRLQVARIKLPPLREIKEDIPLLIHHFLNQNNSNKKMDIESMNQLIEYPWPGNVRELKNAIVYAIINSTGNVIHIDDFPPEVKAYFNLSRFPEMMDLSIEQQNIKFQLLETLNKANGNKSVAAKLLNINRTTLYRRMEKYSIPL